MIQYMFITNDPDLAQYAENCGVGRIFVDLERLGKKERQGHLDTLISQHSLDDIPKIKSKLNKAKLLVRLNPLHDHTKYEVDSAISAGADLLMLPMFRSADEVRVFSDYVNERVGIIPLVETYSAAKSIEDLVKVRGLTEVYIGLNDLHLDMKLDFIFEPLASGFVDHLVDVIKAAGLPFGFGGIARVGEGIVPGEAVLAEHKRLGSSSVILSRTFHRETQKVEDLEKVIKFRKEIQNLKLEEEKLDSRSQDQIDKDKKKFKAIVERFVERKRNEAPL